MTGDERRELAAAIIEEHRATGERASLIEDVAQAARSQPIPEEQLELIVSRVADELERRRAVAGSHLIEIMAAKEHLRSVQTLLNRLETAAIANAMGSASPESP